jgi:hypothetical protein
MGTETLSKRSAYNKNWASKNQEKIRAYSLKWRLANAEKIKASAKARREANREKFLARERKHREANRDKRLAYAKQYHEKNRAKENERARAYHASHVEKRKVYAKKWHEENYSPERRARVRDAYCKRTYGVSVEVYNALLEAQGRRCAVCEIGADKARLDIDHCHAAGHIRGLLCGNCNNGLGRFHDNPAVLRKAAEYIERNS